MFAISRLRTATQRICKPSSAVRHGGTWSYRQVPKAPNQKLIIAEVMGATLWYWLLLHFWYQPEHVVGHFPYPDPSKWTDEELGIPPDDVE